MLAVGFSRSGGMKDSDLVIGWAGTPGTSEPSSIKTYVVGDAKVAPTPDASQTITEGVVEEVSGKTTLRFVRKRNNGGKSDLSATPAPTLIWALADADGVAYHGTRKGYAAIDFRSGAAAEGKMLNLEMKIAHGCMMLLGWGIMLPAGVWIARNTKNNRSAPGGKDFWFVWHTRLQIGGLLLATAGFAVALVMVDGAHFAKSHAYGGAALMAIGWLQPLNAFLRPHPLDERTGAKSGARKTWEFVHKGAGRLAIACAPLVIVSGLYAIEASIGFVLFYAIIAFTILLLFITAALRGKSTVQSVDVDGRTAVIELAPDKSTKSNAVGDVTVLSSTPGAEED